MSVIVNAFLHYVVIHVPPITRLCFVIVPYMFDNDERLSAGLGVSCLQNFGLGEVLFPLPLMLLR